MRAVSLLNTANSPDLFRRVQNGDEQALADAFRLYCDVVYGIALRVTASRADAQDILQNVFIALPEALRRAGPVVNELAWIKTVAARRSIDTLRAQKRRREDTLADCSASTQSTVGGTIEAIALEVALAELPETLRTVVVLKEVEGYSHAEIAQMLGIAENTSEVRLYRAKKALRNLLRE